MVSRLLERLARYILQSPERVIVLALVPTVVLAWVGVRAPQDLSFTGLMDRSHEEVERYLSSVETLQLGSTVTFILEGEEDDLIEATRALAPALEAHPAVKFVVYEPPVSWLLENAPYWVDTDVFERWLGLATRPDDTENAVQLAADLKQLETAAKRFQREGLRLLFVELRAEPLSLSVGTLDVFSLERLALQVLEKWSSVTLQMAGLPVIVAQDQVKTLGTVQTLTPFTLVLVLLLFRLVERNLLRLATVAIPMVLAIGATLGITSFFLGALTVMEMFFGIMVLGLGADFALHLIVRLREERMRGLGFDSALVKTLRGTGTGVIAGAITTIGAFFVISIAPDPSARHLGVSGGFGLLLCLFLMLTVLPASWTLLERHTRFRIPRRNPSLPLFQVVEVLARFSARHPKPVLTFSGVVLLASLLGVPRFQFETDLEKVFNRSIPAVEQTRRLQELVGVGSTPWFIGTKSLEEAYVVEEKFTADPRFGHIDSATRYVRKDRHERLQKLIASNTQIDAQTKVYEALQLLATTEEEAQLRRGATLLDLLSKAAQKGPPELQSLPALFRSQLLGPNGEVIVFAYVTEPSFDANITAQQRIAAREVHPDATGMGALLEMMMGFDRPWIWPLFFAVLAFVVGWLFVDLRNKAWVLLAATPVLMATSMTFGILCWANVGFSLITALVVPLIIGLGVDDGIHVVHRMREEPTLSPDQAAASVGRAIFMTTATTCISFSALMVTNHAGMESMGLVMLIGLPLCLLASVTTLPALAVQMKLGAPPNDPSASSPTTKA